MYINSNLDSINQGDNHKGPSSLSNQSHFSDQLNDGQYYGEASSTSQLDYEQEETPQNKQRIRQVIRALHNEAQREPIDTPIGAFKKHSLNYHPQQSNINSNSGRYSQIQTHSNNQRSSHYQLGRHSQRSRDLRVNGREDYYRPVQTNLTNIKNSNSHNDSPKPTKQNTQWDMRRDTFGKDVNYLGKFINHPKGNYQSHSREIIEENYLDQEYSPDSKDQKGNPSKQQIKKQQIQEQRSQPTVAYYSSHDARERTVLENSFLANGKLLIGQTKELLKLNQLNQIKADSEDIKSKIQQLTVTCRRLRIVLRSRNGRSIKKNDNYFKGHRKVGSAKQIYGSLSPTGRLANRSPSVHARSSEDVMEQKIRQQKDRINKSNTRITQLDNHIKVLNKKIAVLERSQRGEDPYNIQFSRSESAFSKLHSNAASTMSHKQILVQKKIVIKDSLDGMIGYRSKKADQVRHETQLLRRQLELTNFKIQKTKEQTRRLVDQIRLRNNPIPYKRRLLSPSHHEYGIGYVAQKYRRNFYRQPNSSRHSQSRQSSDNSRRGFRPFSREARKSDRSINLRKRNLSGNSADNESIVKQEKKQTSKRNNAYKQYFHNQNEFSYHHQDSEKADSRSQRSDNQFVYHRQNSEVEASRSQKSGNKSRIDQKNLPQDLYLNDFLDQQSEM